MNQSPITYKSPRILCSYVADLPFYSISMLPGFMGRYRKLGYLAWCEPFFTSGGRAIDKELEL